MNLNYQIYNDINQLPNDWDDIAVDNVFLKKKYLEVLQNASTDNMQCNYIGIFKEQELVGIAITQYLNLNKVSSFGERDNCIKTIIRNFIFRNFSSHVLFIGNNMLTGQNAFAFNNRISIIDITISLEKATKELIAILKKQKIKIHLTVFKDFNTKDTNEIKQLLPKFYQFTTQPNMVFTINENWVDQESYIGELTKKYRDQFKRANKKHLDIIKRKMSKDEIKSNEKIIHDLYLTVAKNAPFNTFFLTKNHFYNLKKQLGHDFLFYGYFIDEKLIGFNTLIKNEKVMETYFLGYDESIQREKMLYLNMLYDMIAYSIHKKFKTIVFARTALEIKSSVGAKPVNMYGFLKHRNYFINKIIGFLFTHLEPKAEWKERNPFK